MEFVQPLWGPPPPRLELQPGDIHVWLASCDPPRARLTEMRRLLSPDESARAGRFRLEQDRARFIFSRATLRTLLARYLSADPRHLRFHRGSFGKPGLSGDSASTQVQFSLSRSGRLSLFGVTIRRRIGVDLEAIRPMPDMEQVASLIFSASERRVWSRLPAQHRRRVFFSGFTRKEACVKAIGIGLFQSLETVEVSLVPEEPARVVRINGCAEEGSRWSLHELNPACGHVAALVTENGPCRISCWTWQPEGA